MSAIRLVRRSLMIACGLSLSISAMAFAAPPTDEQIQAINTALEEWQKNAKPEERNYETYQAKVAELTKDINVDELSVAQMQKLAGLLQADPAKADAMAKRLTTLSAEKTVDGANAAVMAVMFSMRDPQAMSDAVGNALRHPAIVEAARTEAGADIFGLVGYIDADVAAKYAAEILSLQEAITPDMSPAALAQSMEYLSALNNLGDKADAATKAAVRDRIVANYQAAIEKMKAENKPENARAIARIENNLQYLNGAAARGELIDHAAPAMTFLWSSGDTPITGIEQFKGKVVVVDFWATWCGPCIASFPNIAELQEHYKDYNVVILGVTSPQGKHYPGDGAAPIDTEGDTAKEFELMKAFMAAKNMTWQVAFTEQNVFNPDYGVRGIPHVAIIDTEGKVRFNGLHPMVPMEEKTAKIDGLLKAAGMAVPAPVEAKPEMAEGAKKPG